MKKEGPALSNPTNPTEIQSISHSADKESSYYPLMLNVMGQPCFVVGGGAVAERKAQGLLEAGARVTMVSPSFTPQLEVWEQQGRLTLVREAYRCGMPEVREALLLFAATDNHEVNEAVCLEARALGKLVNSADDAEGSGFIVPAVVRRGKLLLTVSTSGASPAVARKVREQLEQSFGEEYEVYLDLLHELRLWVQANVSGTQVRQEMFRHMLAWPLLDWIRTGALHQEAKDELLDRLASEPTVAGIAAVSTWIQEQVKDGSE